MNCKGNLRKMGSSLVDGIANYELRLFDGTTPGRVVPVNDWVGQRIRMGWTGRIHCVETGKLIKKTFGEGMSFEAFRSSPRAVESIIRPELSRIHEGIALRDREWEEAHHNRPHYVYLSLTSGVKVGVTRTLNVPSRWIDQGAVEAIVVAETPYRQLAGLMEVGLKERFADRTQWQQMLKGIRPEGVNLEDQREEAFEVLGEAYEPFFDDASTLVSIGYPVNHYPPKVSSLKPEKLPMIESELVGIKGQYLLFGNGAVFNVRSHAGYEMEFALE